MQYDHIVLIIKYWHLNLTTVLYFSLLLAHFVKLLNGKYHNHTKL